MYPRIILIVQCHDGIKKVKWKRNMLWVCCYYKLTSEFRFWENRLLSNSRNVHNWWCRIYCGFFLFACCNEQEWGDNGGTERYYCSTEILNKPDNKIICCYWKTLPVQSRHLFLSKRLSNNFRVHSSIEILFLMYCFGSLQVAYSISSMHLNFWVIALFTLAPWTRGMVCASAVWNSSGHKGYFKKKQLFIRLHLWFRGVMLFTDPLAHLVVWWLLTHCNFNHKSYLNIAFFLVA